MQKSTTTSRMKNSYWLDHDRPVSMTRFAAAVRAEHSIHLPRSNGRPSSWQDEVSEFT